MIDTANSILPEPDKRRFVHECALKSDVSTAKSLPLGTLVQCARCGTWWYNCYLMPMVGFNHWAWRTVQFYHLRRKKKIRDYKREKKANEAG